MLQPLQPMIIYECNMLIDDELIIFLLHKDDHIQNMKNEEMQRPMWTLIYEKYFVFHVTNEK